jgi:aryl-alcohol dehydrogenase-like predicted oxidoreductase
VTVPALLHRLEAAHRDGLIRAIGVSNFDAAQLRAAHAELRHASIPLASNQVQYSLVHRAPETDGIRETCRELGVTLIAYSPLGMGALTGKYGPDRRPGGIRRVAPHFRARRIGALIPLLDLLAEIADRHHATRSQIALRWLIEQGAMPIPGAKNGQQAAANAGALGQTCRGRPTGKWSSMARPPGNEAAAGLTRGRRCGVCHRRACKRACRPTDPGEWRGNEVPPAGAFADVC